ncbi:DUF397 domain-containing protein [Actinocrispum wychmicini]|uniref:Uncharacterized protein DUF397 n=1 Tax=Actinocrispum wychmicini TaxID=1213861 RepID=A0A4R2K7E1_9PSEU|nr:DUF397 domain-containing protein [Actinocrispum wychmicini]TCO65869.1 uncharacterized protein DUF397 [Actinocrispum wychmicini]
MDLANADWRKSSYSGSSGGCVEVAMVPGVVGVRDTKNRDAGTLRFPESSWRLLTRSVTPAS